MKKTALVLLLSIACLCACQGNGQGNSAATATNGEKDIVTMDFKVNDSFDFSSTNHLGENISEMNWNADYTLAIYISEHCGACQKAIRFLDTLTSTFSSDKFDYVLLWQDEIPKDMVDDNNLDIQKCYALNNTVKLDDMTPAFFIVDKEGSFLNISNDFGETADALLDLNILSKGELMDNANQYLLDNILPESDKPHLFYFAMEGCPDCQQADPIVDSAEIADTFELTTLYRENDPDDGRLIDHYSFYKKIYGIIWYPSFLILDGNGGYSIVGEVPIDQLKEILLEKAI